METGLDYQTEQTRDPQQGGPTGQTNASAASNNLTWHEMKLHRLQRAEQKLQRPCVLWFTGLSGAGKSTVANLVEQQLFENGRHTYLLDGDNVRHGLNKDLGFSDADRVENIRRVSEVANLMADAGLITLVSFISPFRSERRLARELLGAEVFIEVYVDAPLALCEQRDPKGIYRKARAGEIKNFTGIDSAYEIPERADLVLDSAAQDPVELALQVIDYLKRYEYI